MEPQITIATVSSLVIEGENTLQANPSVLTSNDSIKYQIHLLRCIHSSPRGVFRRKQIINTLFPRSISRAIVVGDRTRKDKSSNNNNN